METHLNEECPKRIVECHYSHDEFFFLQTPIIFNTIDLIRVQKIRFSTQYDRQAKSCRVAKRISVETFSFNSVAFQKSSCLQCSSVQQRQFRKLHMIL